MGESRRGLEQRWCEMSRDGEDDFSPDRPLSIRPLPGGSQAQWGSQSLHRQWKSEKEAVGETLGPQLNQNQIQGHC